MPTASNACTSPSQKNPTCGQRRKNVRACKDTSMHTSMHTNMHTSMHTNMHTNMRARREGAQRKGKGGLRS